MKHCALLVALLLGSALPAHADTDIWDGAGTTDQMNAAAGHCLELLGPNPPGVPTSPEYKQCMRRQGWKFVRTRHDGTWQRGGQTCHYILNGMGSECDAF